MSETLGIIGGGQLGRMMTTEAQRLGMGVIVIDPGENSPAAQVGAEQIVAPLTDVDATERLATSSDYVTWEIEHINAGTLIVLHQNPETKAQIEPSPNTLATIHDKLTQKRMLMGAGIPVSPFMAITDKESAVDFLDQYGQDGIIIKSRRGGYDGRGNRVAKSNGDIDEAMEHFGEAELYAEMLQPLEREVSVIIARGSNGQTAVYDAVDAMHENNILHTVIAPSQATEDVLEQAQEIAHETMAQLDGKGVFAIEMLVKTDGDVMVNEIAPRVHNTGHHTIESSYTNQFEQHVRAVSGLPLGNPGLKVGTAVMVNVLGDRNGDVDIKGLGPALDTEAKLHLYGKSPTKVARKMGHLTVVSFNGETVEEVVKRAELARKMLQV